MLREKVCNKREEKVCCPDALPQAYDSEEEDQPCTETGMLLREIFYLFIFYMIVLMVILSNANYKFHELFLQFLKNLRIREERMKDPLQPVFPWPLVQVFRRK